MCAILVMIGLAAILWPPSQATAAGGITLAINQVDDSAFPDVAAYVTLNDATGAPIADVPAAAFTAAEDRQPIASLNVRPVINEGRSIALILALDVSGSMQGAPLDATRAAARSLIEGLGPQDRVALLAFNQQVTWVQEFTSDRATLIKALDGLSASGDTAFNDALHAAGRRMGALPAGRRAIIMLTDGEDTASATAFTQALSTAQGSNTPVFTVGFGPKVKPDLLRQIAQLTGGQYFGAPQAAELQRSFQGILGQLKQQYIVTYRSQIPPDMLEHELLVRAIYAQDVLEDSRRFVARAITPTVTLASPTDGTSIRGSVTLAPAIVSASPISQVVYLLDGQPIATLTSEPFTLTWDAAAAAPGQHTLTLEAVDQDGRRGSSRTNITVVPPLVIRFRSPVEGAVIGGQITLGIEAEAAYDLMQVTYRLDGQDIDTITAPPFQILWRTASVSVGPHRLTAQARDVEGHTAEATTQIHVVSPVVVQVRAPAAGEIVSGAVNVIADVQATSGLARVEFWADGTQQAVRDTGPYEFTWDSRSVAPGEHTLRVLAIDLLGEKGEGQVSVKVPLAQQSLPRRWLWGLIVGGMLLIALVALIARWRIRREVPLAKPPVGRRSDRLPSAPAPSLTWSREDGIVKRFILVEGENTIGRAAGENRIVIPAPTVSRQHAMIVIHGGAAMLRNLSERSHSAVNGDLVDDTCPLRPGDQIELGDERLIFSIEEDPNEQ